MPYNIQIVTQSSSKFNRFVHFLWFHISKKGTAAYMTHELIIEFEQLTKMFFLYFRFYQFYCTNLQFIIIICYYMLHKIPICDAIWENLPHGVQGNFAEINKKSLKCYVYLYFLFTLLIHNFGCWYHRGGKYPEKGDWNLLNDTKAQNVKFSHKHGQVFLDCITYIITNDHTWHINTTATNTFSQYPHLKERKKNFILMHKEYINQYY